MDQGMSPALNDVLMMVLANSLHSRVLLQSSICSHCHHLSILNIYWMYCLEICRHIHGLSKCR